MDFTSMAFWTSIYDAWMQFGLIAPFSLALLESIIPALPFAAIVVLNVATYGSILGFFTSYLGTACGSLLVFLFFRFFVKRYVENYIEKHESIKKLFDWIADSSHFSLLILCAVPFMPSSFINIGYGLSDFPKRSFITLLFMGKCISTLGFVLFGRTLSEAMDNPVFLLIAFAILALLVILSNYIKHKIGFKDIEK